MSSIDSPPIGEKYRLMQTVVSTFEEPFTWSHKNYALWKKFCSTLFKFNSAELQFFNSDHSYLFSDIMPECPEDIWLVPEPVLSHLLTNVAISCMQDLHRWDSNISPTRDHFLASWLRWATKSKQSPWLWRRLMRVTSMGRRQPIWDLDRNKYSFPQNLRRSCPIFYSETIHSQKFYQKQQIFYIWALDLLYHTLRKAMKSDLLTRALSKPFIPSLAPLLFPRRVKRVRKAAAAFLEKVSRNVLI